MLFVPAAVVTGIGSLPLMSMSSAIRSDAESSPEVRFWPQLPRLSERESVIGQGLGIAAASSRNDYQRLDGPGGVCEEQSD